jgi:hypothetical protein
VRYVFTQESEASDPIEPDGLLFTVGVKFLF